MRSPEEDVPLVRLAGQLGVQLTWLVLPFAAVLFLPLSLGVAGWLILLVSEWMLSKLKGQAPFWAQQVCISWTFGLGVAVFRQVHGFWAIPAALLTIILGLWVVSKFERLLGLKLEPSPHSSAPSARPTGASAWGGGAPAQTPEGGLVRVLYEGEFAMGGPVISTYLLPDGIIVESASPSARFSPGGRYFVSPMPSRNDWGLLILDRTEKCLYLCVGHPAFWELDEVNDTTISGRESPLTSNAVHEADIETLKREAQREPLMAFHDLWLQASRWRAHLPDESLQSIPSPHTVHLLQYQVRMPSELRTCRDPLDAIAHPRGELIVDGLATGMRAFLPIEPIWRDDGKAFALRAAQGAAEDAADEWWHWSEQGFQRLGLAWHKAPAEPDLMSGEGLALDHTTFTLTAELGTPSLSYGDWGEFHGTTYAQQDLMIGHDDEGIARIHTVPLREVVIALPLDCVNTRGHAVVESAETRAGRACFQWQRDDAEGSRGAYRCSIGTWQLPGMWLLDHVVSDCGRYLALIGFAEAPAVPYRVVVADVQEAALREISEAMPNAQFQAFVMGRLQLLRLIGRIDYRAPQGPGEGDPGLLRRIDEAVPEASQAHAFARYRGDSRLFYEIERIDVDGAALTPVPGTWVCHEPPAANVGDLAGTQRR